MRDKVFQGLLSIIEIKIVEIQDYFISYHSDCEKKIKTIKSGSYAGYEVEKSVREFEEKVNLKATELLSEVHHVIVDSNRHFSSKQIKFLIEKSNKCFDSIIYNFYELIVRNFEMTEKIEIMLKNKKENIRNKIKKHIDADKIFADRRIDRALYWSIAIGVVSIFLTLISIIASFFINYV